MSFRPLIRGFFFYVLKCVQHYSEENKAFPSPYSGILFLSGCIPKKPKWAKYVSVPSFGDSFFIGCIRCQQFHHNKSFRPLIRGFFFYFNIRSIQNLSHLFPSPHSGILFLYKISLVTAIINLIVSVPSFGDSFFITGSLSFTYSRISKVSVPSFGDSFFI